MCRPGWARMCPQWGGRTHAEKLLARWEPLGRACLPLGRRVHYINLLKYKGIAGIFKGFIIACSHLLRQTRPSFLNGRVVM